ncbi:MAG: adenylate/guanylate cyclase domain-containing protein [Buchananella hordeovulneris]|nr:adenylate/guanylate cyclase domain-containing protein [Buchananella hordeovulneris]
MNSEPGNKKSVRPAPVTAESLSACQCNCVSGPKRPLLAPRPEEDSPANTLERYARKLMGETPLTMSEFAAAAGATREQAEDFWRGIGQVVSQTETPQFGEMDVHALRTYLSLAQSGRVDQETARTLLRASQTTDRLALWQVEAYVDYVIRSQNLDDTTARIVALDRMEEFLADFEEQLHYTWRRQMLSLLTRMDSDYARAGLSETDGRTYPLQRTLGFVDMAGFSRHSARIGATALAELIGKFEAIVRDLIAAHGARIVKTIGDAVLYIADDLPTGTEVAVALVERLTQTEGLLPVRASVVEGSVVSRFGDVFGPTVNLASRLVNEAQPGQLLTDGTTAAAIERSIGKDRYKLEKLENTELRGIGETLLVAVSRPE